MCQDQRSAGYWLLGQTVQSAPCKLSRYTRLLFVRKVQTRQMLVLRFTTPEVRRGEYWGLRVLHYNCMNLNIVQKVVKIRNTSEAVLMPQYSPWSSYCPGSGLGQYDSIGEYYDPHTASSVFLILLPPGADSTKEQSVSPCLQRPVPLLYPP